MCFLVVWDLLKILFKDFLLPCASEKHYYYFVLLRYFFKGFALLCAPRILFAFSTSWQKLARNPIWVIIKTCNWWIQSFVEAENCPPKNTTLIFCLLVRYLKNHLKIKTWLLSSLHHLIEVNMLHSHTTTGPWNYD